MYSLIRVEDEDTKAKLVNIKMRRKEFFDVLLKKK